jgi:tetratricopeptide (TPR) repeat protein
MVDWASGGEAGDRFGRKALRLYEELGDLSNQANILNNLGVRAGFEGKLTDAQELFRGAEDGYTKVGDAPGAVFAAYNRAEVLIRQGRLEDAEGLLRDSLRVARAVHDKEGVAFATREMGRVAGRSGRSDESLALLHDARSHLSDLGARNEMVDANAAIAETLLRQGRWNEALVLVSDSMQQARVAAATILPTLHRLQGYALLQAGRAQEARHSLGEALDLAKAQHAEHEAAFALQALSYLARREGNDEVAEDLDRQTRGIQMRVGTDHNPEMTLLEGST